MTAKKREDDMVETKDAPKSTLAAPSAKSTSPKSETLPENKAALQKVVTAQSTTIGGYISPEDADLAVPALFSEEYQKDGNTVVVTSLSEEDALKAASITVPPHEPITPRNGDELTKAENSFRPSFFVRAGFSSLTVANTLKKIRETGKCLDEDKKVLEVLERSLRG